MNANQTPLVDLLRLHAEDLYSDYGHNKSARLLSQAADEIERLRSSALALEDEKNDYMDGVGDVLRQDHDGETLWAAAQRVMSECDRLRAELASWQEAFGLLTTLHGSVQIDSSDPMGVAKQIESHVRAELAEARTVKESLIVALDLLGRHSPKGKPCPVCEAIDAAMAGGEHGDA